VIVEGTQGFGLSLLHGPHYPHVTSRDTTASGFASEVGLPPAMIKHVIMVIRTFPIRVGGDSGPMANEISWEEVQQIGGAPTSLPEFTSVTRRLRRVGRFDSQLVIRACQYNQPTSLAVMGLDRLDHDNTAAASVDSLSIPAREFLANLEASLNTKVRWVGTGFSTTNAIRWIQAGEAVHSNG
jgi:adenylosuccinate synthase